MKIVKSFFFLMAVAFTAANALTLHKLSRCLDEVEIDGVVYEDYWLGFGLYRTFFRENFGADVPGLSFRSVIKDSTLYLVEANLCFTDYAGPTSEKTEAIQIPIKEIFPEADSDTIPMKSVTAMALLVRIPYENGGFNYLFIQNGRLYRFYRKGEPADAEFYSLYNSEDDRSSHEPDSNPEDSRYKELMKRLKPYYGEKLWKLVE